MKRIIFIALIVVIAAGAAALSLTRRSQPGLSASLALPGEASAAFISSSEPSGAVAGFSRADGRRPLQFPVDHGPHDEYQTEWWYYTGNLAGPDGRRFGYQLTFFRRALTPPTAGAPLRDSSWASNQAYMAHFAVTDAAAERHLAFERLSRGAAGLAGAQAEPFEVWLEDWSVSQVAPGTYRLVAAQDGVALDLLLEDRRGPVLQGQNGYSRKGPEPGNASYYYSFTRLVTSGSVTSGGETIAVSGASWMDHEFSTSALSAGQIGWDWFSIQLDEAGDSGENQPIAPTEIMVFQIRRDDGSIDPYSSMMLIYPDGATQPLAQSEFSIEASASWSSPQTGAVYPARWRIQAQAAGIDLTLLPLIADQELNLTYAYWEGAARISGSIAGQAVSGFGYAELTGYAGSMGGEF
jgi:predicted secreted hydrolase